LEKLEKFVLIKFSNFLLLDIWQTKIVSFQVVVTSGRVGLSSF